MIQKLGLENVEVCALEQLRPELSTKLAKVDYAIFVDACQRSEAGVKIKTLVAVEKFLRSRSL